MGDAAHPAQVHALKAACTALWLATLSLMTAFMQQRAPAHRVLLARRISRNLDTLSRQDVFGEQSRLSFARLSLRWEANAGRLRASMANEPAARPRTDTPEVLG